MSAGRNVRAGESTTAPRTPTSRSDDENGAGFGSGACGRCKNSRRSTGLCTTTSTRSATSPAGISTNETAQLPRLSGIRSRPDAVSSCPSCAQPQTAPVSLTMPLVALVHRPAAAGAHRAPLQPRHPPDFDRNLAEIAVDDRAGDQRALVAKCACRHVVVDRSLEVRIVAERSDDGDRGGLRADGHRYGLLRQACPASALRA